MGIITALSWDKRLTSPIGDGHYTAEGENIKHDAGGFTGNAIDKLAVFENIYDDLIKQQEEISRELEKLRNEDKTKSVRFRQLLTTKMSNSNVLILFKSYGL